MDIMGGWLRNCDGQDRIAMVAVQEYLGRLTVRYDELSALLDIRKQQETNRPIHLFEDV